MTYTTFMEKDQNQKKPRYKRLEKKEKGKRDYIDKDEFYQALVKHKQITEEREQQGLPRIPISDEIGKFIMKLVDRILKSGRFNGYTDLWKDEMRTEAHLSAVKSIDKFDTEKFKNPFAYFTTVIYYTFYNTIKELKKAHNTAIEYNTEEHNDYTPIGADGFEYYVSEMVHDSLANHGIGFEAGYTYKETGNE